MIIRSRSHVIEEESRRAFNHAIPAEWVVRGQNPDYGLDNQVQIFKENQATPFFFFVQLKASDTIPESLGTPSETFSCKHLLHYLEYSSPVMLVLYDATSKRLFFEWTHVLYNSLSSEDKRKWHLQKTVTVKFYRLLRETDSILIKREVYQQFYHLGYQPEDATKTIIGIYSEIQTIEATQLRDTLICWLARYPKFNFIRIEEVGIKDGEIRISGDPPIFNFSCGKDSSVFPVAMGIDGSISEEHLHTDLKLLIALILSMSGRINTTIDLIGRIIWDKSPLSPLSIIILSKPSLASLYAKSNRGAEAMVNAEQLLIAGFPMPALVLAASIIQQSPFPQFSQHYRRFVKRVIESPGPGTSIASLHYNLANSLRHDSYHREAIHHYNLAAKEDPSYRRRSYWWAELGGSLFLLKKLTWSERCYRKALELGESRLPVRALLGDVLLHEGKFHEACSEFARYLKEETYPVPEPILKHCLASFLAEKFGDISRKSRVSNSIDRASNIIGEYRRDSEYIDRSLKSRPFIWPCLV